MNHKKGSPSDSINTIDEQRNTGPKIKWESLFRAKRKKAQELNADLHPDRKRREPTEGVDSMKTNNQPSRGATTLFYHLPAERGHHRCTQSLQIICDLDPEKSVFLYGPWGISEREAQTFTLTSSVL